MEHKPFYIDNATIFGLVVALTIMPAAQLLGKATLPKTTPLKYKVLFFWHAYDFLTHYILEGSFLYHCFFSFIELDAPDRKANYSRVADDKAYLWNNPNRRYGAKYSEHFSALPWIEYGKADARWLYADLNVVSLELLTVLLAGPAATYVCWQIYKAMWAKTAPAQQKHLARVWFAAIVLATGELYGGFMTFAPEWLSGDSMLNSADPVYLWFYLTYFNMLWVVFPFWVWFLFPVIARHNTEPLPLDPLLCVGRIFLCYAGCYHQKDCINHCKLSAIGLGCLNIAYPDGTMSSSSPSGTMISNLAIRSKPAASYNFSPAGRPFRYATIFSLSALSVPHCSNLCPMPLR